MINSKVDHRHNHEITIAVIGSKTNSTNNRKDHLKQYFATSEKTVWNNTSQQPKRPLETILRSSRKDRLKQYFPSTEKTVWNNTSQQQKRPFEILSHKNLTVLTFSHRDRALHSILLEICLFVLWPPANTSTQNFTKIRFRRISSLQITKRPQFCPKPIWSRQ